MVALMSNIEPPALPPLKTMMLPLSVNIKEFIEPRLIASAVVFSLLVVWPMPAKVVPATVVTFRVGVSTNNPVVPGAKMALCHVKSHGRSTCVIAAYGEC